MRSNFSTLFSQATQVGQPSVSTTSNGGIRARQFLQFQPMMIMRFISVLEHGLLWA